MEPAEEPFLNALVLIDQVMEPSPGALGDGPASPVSSTQVKFAKYYLSREFKGGFQSTFKNRTLVFRDLQVMAINPEIASRLCSFGKKRESTLTREPPRADSPGRSSDPASDDTEAVAYGGPTLPQNGRGAHSDTFFPKLISWIQNEQEVTPAYRRACRLLQLRAGEALRQRKYADGRPIIEGFSKIALGRASSGPAMAGHAASVLGEMIDEKLAKQLINDFKTGDHQLRDQAAECLISLGTVTAERLLNLLISSENREERFRIIRLLSQIGLPMASLLSKEIRQGGPWYYIRNLALVLAEVGDESHIESLLPLLRHPERRVQREALSAIGKIRWRSGEVQ